MRRAGLLAGTLLLLAVQPSGALTIRGDASWRSHRACPPGWSAADADDSAWAGVAYPWYHHWPRHWEADPAARFLWGGEPGSTTCVRRRFHLAAVPAGPAVANIWVDDDYDFYLNGSLVGSSHDGQAVMPGESYDVSPWLRAGDNVIAVRLIDRGGTMGALFSLTIAGLPDPPPTWGERARAVRPWVQAAAIGALLAVIGWLVVRLRGPWTGLCTRLAPATLAALLAVLASACETVLVTQRVWQGMTEFIPFAASAREFPLAHWNWPALAGAAVLFLLLVLCSAAANAAAGERAPARRAEVLAVTAILLVAVILRAYRVDSIPVGFFQDEAFNANDAFDLIQFHPETGLRMWVDSSGGRPTLFLYLVGVCAHLLGSSYLSLKIVPVLLGVGAVAATYVYGRVAFGPRVALWAAFFLAVSRWHIHYSRMAWEAICVPFFATLGFALVLRGLRPERRGVFSLAGGALVLSAGLYTYAGYRAVPVVALGFIIAMLVSAERRVIVRRDKLVGLLAAGVLAAAVASPLALFAWHEPARYWLHYHDVSIVSYLTYFGTPMPWLHMFGKGVLSFNALGDELIRHNLPLAPHLDVLTGTVFLVGLAASVWALRSPGVRLLWIWLLTVVGLAALTREMPHATRLLGLSPVAALFAAVGTVRLLAPLRAWRRGAAWVAVSGGLVLGVTGLNAYQYFAVEANDPRADSSLNYPGRTLCEYVRQLDGVDIYWTPEIAFFAGDQCHFLARGRYADHELTLEGVRNPTALRTQRPVVAVIGVEFLAAHRAEISRAADGRPLLDFPVEPIVQHDRQGRPLYYLYRF